jgi:hypothetical protein
MGPREVHPLVRLHLATRGVREPHEAARWDSRIPDDKALLETAADRTYARPHPEHSAPLRSSVQDELREKKWSGAMSEPHDTSPRPAPGRQTRAHVGWTIAAVAAMLVIAAVIWSTTDYSRTASKSEDQTTGQSTPAGRPWSGPPGPPSPPR